MCMCVKQQGRCEVVRVRVIPLHQRERGKRGREALLHVKKRRDKKWTINEWLCSPGGLGSPADEELTLTGKSQLGTGLSIVCTLFLFIPVPNPHFQTFHLTHQPLILFLATSVLLPIYFLPHSLSVHVLIIKSICPSNM